MMNSQKNEKHSNKGLDFYRSFKDKNKSRRKSDKSEHKTENVRFQAPYYYKK